MSFSSEFCPTLTEMLQTNQSIGKSGRIFSELGALSTVNNLSMLRRLMYETRAERTLEIGLSFGGSALVFCASHKWLGRPSQGQHVALDPFQSTVWDSCGLIALERAALVGYLEFREAYSALELPKMIQAGNKFDLIYVDGSHLIEDVFVDAYFAIRLLSNGGIVVFDDSSNQHVAKVLRFLRKTVPHLEEIDLSLYRQDRLAYRIGRLFGKVQLSAFRRVGNVERVWNAPYRSF